MAKKRKTLPREFKDLIDAVNIEALKKAFDKCEIDAYSGYNKKPALSFFNIPDEFVRWLVEQGADINATDATYGRTPLHTHAMARNGDITVFLELGADFNLKDKDGETPLHVAAGSCNFRCVEQLVKKGADILAVHERGLTPLEKALSHARNIDLGSLAKIADIFLGKGQKITPKMQELVTRLGENFEFHRAGFNKDHLDETDQALSHLYKIFDVIPVVKRNMHDGISPIILKSKDWKENYSQLWDLLIPSNGSADTVQGEVVRISGKVRDEIFRNGGCNWGSYHKKMLDTYIILLKSGNPLSDDLLKEAEGIVKVVRTSGDGDEELNRLCELSVLWVTKNPNPIALGKTDY